MGVHQIDGSGRRAITLLARSARDDRRRNPPRCDGWRGREDHRPPNGRRSVGRRDWRRCRFAPLSKRTCSKPPADRQRTRIGQKIALQPGGQGVRYPSVVCARHTPAQPDSPSSCFSICLTKNLVSGIRGFWLCVHRCLLVVLVVWRSRWGWGRPRQFSGFRWWRGRVASPLCGLIAQSQARSHQHKGRTGND